CVGGRDLADAFLEAAPGGGDGPLQLTDLERVLVQPELAAGHAERRLPIGVTDGAYPGVDPAVDVPQHPGARRGQAVEGAVELLERPAGQPEGCRGLADPAARADPQLAVAPVAVERRRAAARPVGQEEDPLAPGM